MSHVLSYRNLMLIYIYSWKNKKKERVRTLKRYHVYFSGSFNLTVININHHDQIIPVKKGYKIKNIGIYLES